VKSIEPGQELAKMIKKAISDCKLSNTEYEQILSLANDDKVIDTQEKKLLNQLQELLANRTVKRVPG